MDMNDIPEHELAIGYVSGSAENWRVFSRVGDHIWEHGGPLLEPRVTDSGLTPRRITVVKRLNTKALVPHV